MDGSHAVALPAPGGAVTRRGLLALGGASAVALGLRAAATPAPAVEGAPAHLRRSTYERLRHRRFSVVTEHGAPQDLDLVAVGDLPGLRGSEDAFALTFAGPPALEQGVHRLAHPDLGAFDLLLVPAPAPRYAAIVNRASGA